MKLVWEPRSLAQLDACGRTLIDFAQPIDSISS